MVEIVENIQNEFLIEKHDAPAIKPNIRRDKCNIFLLLILYTLQGVPLGLSLTIPIIMRNEKKNSFNDQAKFSFAVWPFSMKLLWAPLVDCLYIRKFGRRKSWLIPVQYSLGIFFIVTGLFINAWLINVDKPNVVALTVMFFILNFLAATQDIIVDGWAITLFKRKNVSYAAMCNSAGQAFGIFLGFVFLIMLMSETFWNKWRSSPQPYGIVSLQGYLYFWGVMYVTVTTLIAIFKTENDYYTDTEAAIRFGISKTYKLLFKIMKLRSIKMLAIVLLTVRISFASIDAAYKLKLIDGGITKDQIAGIEFLIIPLRISVPILITKFTSKEKPLKNFYNTVLYRLFVGIIFTLVIFFTPTFLAQTGPLLIAFKICLVLVYFLEQIMMCVMMQMIMAFYANISDPQIGGTNMTLLSTIGNIGVVWSKTVALWLIDVLTFKSCSNDHTNLCSSKNYQNLCESSGGTCKKIDGFFVETIACFIYGLLWYCFFKKIINSLQSKNVKEWHVNMGNKESLWC